MRIFLAGATGAIGRRLVPMLQAAGHVVIGTTRSEQKAAELRRAGVEPVVLDMFDRDAVGSAVRAARAETVIHQLTDLPKIFDPVAMAEARKRNARLREVATPILMEAARSVGIRRAIVQSICFAYREGPRPQLESDTIEIPSIVAMEDAALNTPGVEGVILRYGRLWGPGTWTDVPKDSAPLHVDAAAHAALLAIDRGAPGIYNIAEDDGTVSVDKARRELGFDAAYRLPERGRR